MTEDGDRSEGALDLFPCIPPCGEESMYRVNIAPGKPPVILFLCVHKFPAPSPAWKMEGLLSISENAAAVVMQTEVRE